MTPGDVVLLAPLTGWLTPLDEVPDPVFAERMMGDGIAIDPTQNIVHSPADGTVIAIPETAHAVTLRVSNGAELLIHVGLETVGLSGAGFRALSESGAQVKAGDPLIEFDLDAVARKVRSLVTPIVVASEGCSIELEPSSRLVSKGEPIGKVTGRSQADPTASEDGAVERSVTIVAAHGLHARPAARIAGLLRPFDADVSLIRGGRSANARSVVAMLSLGLRNGDEASILGRGPESREAVDAVAALIESLVGTEVAPASIPSPAPGPMCASPGLVVGEAFQFRAVRLDVPLDGSGAAEERERLVRALRSAAASLSGTGGTAAELADAHRALLADPELAADAEREIERGRSAGFAWRMACERAREKILATGDPLLIERAADIQDVEQRVIGSLVDASAAALPVLPPDSIVVAPDLVPSQLLYLERLGVAGICTAAGGATSHVAILAAASGIPMIAGAGTGVLEIADGTTLILDADRAQVEPHPTAERLSEAARIIAERQSRRAGEARRAKELCFTADGARIEVFANLASVDDAKAAVAAGAEGCGLLRTEFLFLDREAAPDEEEQRRTYAAIAAALGDRPLIVRTLDIGADKHVPYISLPSEENPALGLRGVRLSLARPDLLTTQLSAVLAAVPVGQCRVMLPMVTDVEELRQVRRMLDDLPRPERHSERVPLGVMIETPAAALLADSLAAEADFLSIGTNDLTQYVLAVDRGNAAVSPRADALHPAVLRLIAQAVAGARKHGRWVGVCGALASDPIAAAILIGLGVTEMSVAPAAVPAIKAAVRHLRMDDCAKLAERACAAETARQVRTLAAEARQ